MSYRSLTTSLEICTGQGADQATSWKHVRVNGTAQITSWKHVQVNGADQATIWKHVQVNGAEQIRVGNIRHGPRSYRSLAGKHV